MGAKITRYEFIARAVAKHGDAYDYSKTEYVNSQTKVRLICKVHGEFDLLASSHLQGQGCAICGRAKAAKGLRKTTQQFIEEARTVHGQKFDYSKSQYLQAREKVEIICPHHGSFWQTASEHLGGSGCRKCADLANGSHSRLNPSEFLARAQAVHGDRFDYAGTKYVTAWDPINIVCRQHGPFTQLLRIPVIVNADSGRS